MNARFGRLVIAWALVLVMVWLSDRLYRLGSRHRGH